MTPEAEKKQKDGGTERLPISWEITFWALATTVCFSWSLHVRMASPTGIAFMALAGLCVLAIDFRLPRVIEEDDRLRYLLPIWCVVPFAIAVIVGGLQHYHTRDDALVETKYLAIEVASALQAPAEVAPAKPVAAPAPAHAGSASSPPGSGSASTPMAGSNSAPAGSAAESNSAGSAGSAVGSSSIGAAPGSATDSTILATAGSGSAAPSTARKPSRPEDECTNLPPPRYTSADITTAVNQLTAARFGDSKNEDTARFASLVRTIANDLNRHGMKPACVVAAADHDTRTEFLLAFAVQALFVMWIPCLLAVALAKARKQLRSVLDSDVARSEQSRDLRILAEDRSLFIPRLCFGILLILGTNYVFAPLGLKTTYMMTIVDQHAAPGQTSFTLWVTSFDKSPVLVAGFVGFLLYALVTATQRFAQDDLDDQALFSLLVRGLVVMLLSFALSASSSDGISRLFVFVAGVFPIRALEALGQKVSITLDPDFKSTDSSNFDGLPSLDTTKAFALRAAGIRSTADIAAMNIVDIAERVRINPRLLGRLVDRAILFDSVGKSVADKLEEHGIRLATELVAQQFPSTMPDDLKQIATQAAARLNGDKRVDTVRIWEAAAPAMDSVPPPPPVKQSR